MLSLSLDVNSEEAFRRYVTRFKQMHDYYYTDDDIVFLVSQPPRPDLALWLYRVVAPTLLIIGTVGNVLSAIVMMSKGMRYCIIFFYT